MKLLVTLLIFCRPICFVNTFGLYYDEHLQCDENSFNPGSTICTFTEIKGDQNTMWHYEPQPDTKWSYKINPDKISKVKFVNCEFTEIPKGLFQYFKNIRTVIAKQNGIIGIFQYSFKSASHLEHLDLSYNKLIILNDLIFSECYKLHKLNLSANQIENVSDSALYGLKNLKILDLQWNCIKNLSTNLFQTLLNLEILLLNNNQLIAIDDQQFLTNKMLYFIDLSYNHIEKLDGKQFQYLSKLSMLNITNNNLVIFSTEYFNVKYLQLERNRLKTLNIFHNIEVLQVNGNAIKTLKIIKPGTKINKLHIKNNSLSEISILNVIPDVTYLDLSVNPIGKSLNDDSFKNIVSLESLYLVNCQIEILPPKIFAGLYRLKVVDLSENYLIYIDLTIFSHLTMIEMLFLDGNNLDELNFGVIKNKFENSSVIGLSKNNFECSELKKLIDEIKHCGIQMRLEESNTNMTEVNGVQCFENKKQNVVLKCNELNGLTNKCYFQNVMGEFKQKYAYDTTNIEVFEIIYLIFINSYIMEVPRNLFQTFKFVKYLNVSESTIEEIYIYTFSGARHLMSIDMSKNKLSKLGSYIFSECVILTELDLSYNSISYIAENAFQGLNKLKNLYLNNNMIKDLNHKVFFSLVNIILLNLENNQIDIISENLFEKNINLQEINFSYNFLYYIPPNILKQCIKHFHLTGNNIREITISKEIQKLEIEDSILTKFEVYDGAILNSLLVKNNSLTDISQIAKLKKLENLDISNNKIGYLNPELFVHLNMLTYMKARECGLISIDPIIFRYLTKLQILDISNNNMSGFDLEYVAVLKNLQILNIESCGLKKINKQIIQYQLEELKEIYIDGNFWDCELLQEIIVELKLRKIKFTKMNTEQNGTNIDGINCINRLFINPIDNSSGKYSQQPQSFNKESKESSNLIKKKPICCSEKNWEGEEILHCCTEIDDIRNKVIKLEKEIFNIREANKNDIKELMDAKGLEIYHKLKYMIEKSLDENNTANTAHIHSRFNV